MFFKSIISILNVKGIFVLTFLSIVISAISIAIPYISGKFIDCLISKKNVIEFFSVLFICSFVSIFLKKIHAVFIAKISKQKQLEIQNKYLEKINRYSPYVLEKFPKGELGMKFFRDVQNIIDLLKSLYPQVLDVFCSIVFAFVLTFYTNWIIGFIFFLVFPINFIFISPYIKIFDKINFLYRKTVDKVFNRVFEFFYLLPFLKSISAELYYKRESQVKLSNIVKVACKNDVYQANFNLRISFLLFVGEFLVIGVSAYLVCLEIIKVGDMIFFQLLFVSTFNSFSAIFKLLPIWSMVKESLSSLEELDIDEKEEESKKNINFNGQVELQNISFRYNEASDFILKDFSLSINAGDFISIKGENGAGKTTLLKILTAYLTIQNGNVFFDGINSKEINLHSIREKISVVNQDFLLITDSIKNNITLHNKNFSDEEINNVVKLVGLTSLIEKSSNGLNEKVGNDGKKLSGGEMQKIAIARALIRKPKLIIFDEITNHLDANSQKSILKVIENLKGKITVLFVSHKNEINFNFDKIINL